MPFDLTNVWNTLMVFSPVFKGTLENGFTGVVWGWGDFLHNEPLQSFIDSLLPVFSPHFSPPFWFLFLIVFGFGYSSPLCWLPLPVAASDLSAPKKCRARFGLDQQNNWCGPCRCVWCVLAPAGARWKLGNCALGLPPSLFLSLPLLPLLLLPSVARQAIMSSQLPPATPCRSISRLPLFFFFYLLFGKKGINSICSSVCMNGVCEWGLVQKHYRGFIAGCTVQWVWDWYNILNWQVGAWRIWSLMACSIWRTSQCY